MRKSVLATVTAIALLTATGASHAAESIYSALAKAYENNATLNSARAGVRIANEGVPLAKSGYRPRVQSTASLTHSSTSGGARASSASFGVSISQTIFDGFQTRNNVQSAEAAIRAQRANLTNTEQNILFDAAQAFMDVVEARQIAALRAQNIAALEEQLRSERARFEVGEGTRTDVAQAQATLATARALLASAQGDINSAESVYQQVVGQRPGTLSPAKPLSKLLPKSLGSAEQTALSSHPGIRASLAAVDAGVYDVKSAEGSFLPNVSGSASVTNSSTDSTSGTTTGRLGIDVTIPIYQGGQASATVRQRKESLGQARIEVDVTRDSVRAAVGSSYSQLSASRAALSANQETLRAAQLALSGVVEERNVGQRTTLDVLNARSSVLDAQISLAQSQRNVVVSSYALASATGRLTAKRLGLKVAAHDPEEHYKATKDRWFGLRTPDGR